MFRNSKSTDRAIRKALLSAILIGATIFTASTTSCDPSGVKDVSGNEARLLILPGPVQTRDAGEVYL